MNLMINGQLRAVASEWQDDSLLQVLREPLGLVGAKFGCGVGLCGACTVLVDDQPVRSCSLPAREAIGRAVLTVEGLSVAARPSATAPGSPATSAPGGARLHPVQQAWLDEAVPQCGYCQSGQIMSTVALLRRVPQPSDAQIDAALADNLCRCGTQQRIRRAVHRAARATP
jgi:isoquinoline 1-oxidoreductase subunit alpha